MYVTAYGLCVACRNPFSFNPHCVPSLVINGEREAICRTCFERWKLIHDKPDQPLHPDAYEPADEHDQDL
jgi:hypothetical protein